MKPYIAGEVKRIHLIFKTHLDVGFTDFAENVVNNYFHSYIPGAINLACELRESGSNDRFIWTTGSWLIYEYLEQASHQDRNRIEKAINDGDITWHALPFTVHSENMDASLFQFGLSLSHKLDKKFGKQTIAAKMTDVPGHTRGIIPLLAEAGVQFLHIGVNGASTPPAVPDVFTWREPGGTEIIVMYHKGSYGDLMIVPGLEDAIAFAHTGDNLGPQSSEELRHTYSEMRNRFPGCEIFASTMDNFARKLVPLKNTLPVVNLEIGDTWIHGAGTDPTKESIYRELSRLRREWIGQGITESNLTQFNRKLILVPEHTWGLDVKTHLADWDNYSKTDFQAVRDHQNFQKMERSWQEQRNYLYASIEALPLNLKKQAEDRILGLKAIRPDANRYIPIADTSMPVNLGPFTVKVDTKSGSLIGVTKGKWNVAKTNYPMGRFWYEAFSASDYQRFHRQYNVNKRRTSIWSIPDFTKPGIEYCADEHKIFFPSLSWMGIRHEGNESRLLILLEMPEESWQEYGAPKTLSKEIFVKDDKLTIHLQWFDKPANRLPEAIWFSFNPSNIKHSQWKIDKMSQWISPFEVIRDGNRHLHAVGDRGALNKDQNKSLQIQSMDAGLLAPGQPALLDFNNRQPNLRLGLHFNLYNNLWGTNFPMWYDEDALFRFIINIS